MLEEGDCETLKDIMINHRDSVKRIRAARALCKKGGEGELLRDLGRAAVTDPSEDVRRCAVKVLAELKNEAVTEYLIRALYDTSLCVRTAAAKALGDQGSEKAIEPLKRALKYDFIDVQKSALESLERIKGEEILSEIKTMWDNNVIQFEGEMNRFFTEKFR